MNEVRTAIEDAEVSILQLKTNLPQEKSTRHDHREAVSMLLLHILRGIQESSNGMRSLRARHLLSSRDKLCPVVNSNLDFSVTQPVEQPSALVVELVDEELQLLLEENKQLEERLTTELEEAHRIERKALECTEIVEKFSQLVLEQHHTIEEVYDESSKTNNIVVDAQTELNKALEHGKVNRRFMLIFLLVSGLLLLFLDWIN